MATVWQFLRDNTNFHKQKPEALDLYMHLNHDAEKTRVSGVANVDLQCDLLGLEFSFLNLAILLN